MKKKIIIFGSIASVFILLLVSFNSVVGVQVTQSSVNEKFQDDVKLTVSNLKNKIVETYENVDKNSFLKTSNNFAKNGEPLWSPGEILKLLIQILYILFSFIAPFIEAIVGLIIYIIIDLPNIIMEILKMIGGFFAFIPALIFALIVGAIFWVIQKINDFLNGLLDPIVEFLELILEILKKFIPS